MYVITVYDECLKSQWGNVCPFGIKCFGCGHHRLLVNAVADPWGGDGGDRPPPEAEVVNFFMRVEKFSARLRAQD